MNRQIVRIFLILIILAFAAIACVNGGDGTTSNGGSFTVSENASLTGLDATATYGAEQFHLQLTAVAQPGP